jgi:hypothetical protein
LIEKIEIFTLDGKQVLSYQIPNQKVIEMSIDFLVKGTYLLKVAYTSSRLGHQAMTELSVGPSVFDPANLGSLVGGDARESTSKPAVGVPEKKK